MTDADAPLPDPVPAAIDALAQALTARPLHGSFPRPTGQAAARLRRIAAGQNPDDESTITERKAP